MTIEIYEPESVGMCSARLSRVNDVMQNEINADRFVGINSLVSRYGKIIHHEQYGLMDRQNKQAMTPDTLFRLYSMTKPIICTAFMTLYEQGKFDLKDPVSKYIPAFAQLKVLEKDALGKEKLVDPIQPITIHHLLTHTAGLAYDFYEESPVCRLYRENQILANYDCSLEQLVERLCELPLAYQPGTKWYYSISIDVIARLIEIIADKPLDHFLAETLFKPLGMTGTGFVVPQPNRHKVATMYGGVDLCAPNVSWTMLLDVWQRGVNEQLDVSNSCPIDNPHYMRGGIGLTSSAEDFWRFAQMLLNKGQYNNTRILSPKIIDFMHMNHLDLKLLPLGFADWKLTGYGFGLGSRVLLNVAESQLLGSVGEYGWSGAAKTHYWIDPKEQLIGLFLTQYMCNFSMIERIFQTLVYQAFKE